MSPFTTILSELVAAGLSGPALLEAFARIEASLAFVTFGDAAARRGRPGNPESAGARRTRKWREARAAQPVTASRNAIVTPVVTPVAPGAVSVADAETPGLPEGSAENAPSIGPQHQSGDVTSVPFVTICDAAGQKESPPHPHKKNYPPKPALRRRRHNPEPETPIEVDRSKPDSRGHLWVEATDAVFLEIQANSPTKSLSIGKSGGWWFSPSVIAAARARLGRKVAVLPVRSSTQEGTGPPGKAETG